MDWTPSLSWKLPASVCVIASKELRLLSFPYVFFVARCSFSSFFLIFIASLNETFTFSFPFFMVCLYVLRCHQLHFPFATDFIANIFCFCFSCLFGRTFLLFLFSLFFCSLNNILTTLPIENIGDILCLCENIFALDHQHSLFSWSIPFPS